MRLVTGVAKGAAGVLAGDHLGEPLGLGRILFMTAPAEAADLGQFGNNGAGIVGVLGERTVAAFAGDVGVFACGACFGLVVMAHHAGILAGDGDGPLADGGKGARTVMAVLSEVLGDDGAAQHEEEADSGEQNDGGADEMSRVMEQTAQVGPPWSLKFRQYGIQTVFLSEL